MALVPLQMAEMGHQICNVQQQQPAGIPYTAYTLQHILNISEAKFLCKNSPQESHSHYSYQLNKTQLQTSVMDEVYLG